MKEGKLLIACELFLQTWRKDDNLRARPDYSVCPGADLIAAFCEARPARSDRPRPSCTSDPRHPARRSCVPRHTRAAPSRTVRTDRPVCTSSSFLALILRGTAWLFRPLVA